MEERRAQEGSNIKQKKKQEENKEGKQEEKKELKNDIYREKKKVLKEEGKKKEKGVENNANEIKELLGELTDFKSELSENEDTKKSGGNYVEKYFSAKLKSKFGVTPNANIIIKIKDIIEEIVLYLNEKIIEINKPADDGINIIKQLKAYFKEEMQIEVDTLFPLVKGTIIKNFFETTKDYSYPDIEKFDEKLSYTIIMESTYNLRSQIIKKSEQLRKAFLFFTIIHKFYVNYKEYFAEYYEYFINKYIYQKNIKEKTYEYEYKVKQERITDLSPYGNFVFLISSNSSFKKFEEARKQTDEQILNEEDITLDINKCFQFPLIPKSTAPTTDKKFVEDINLNNIESEKNKDDNLMHGYQKLNYLIKKINMENNCKVKVIYLDTYINILTPKNIIINKIDFMTDYLKVIANNDEKIENELKETKKNLQISIESNVKTNDELNTTKNKLNETKNVVDILVKFIKEKFPDFSLTKLIEESKNQAK